jgi:hypothetical protein
MRVKQSSKLDDIYDVNLRSAGSYSGICIYELGSLDELIGMKKAEEIRKKLVKNKIKTRQLTNHKKLGEWTQLDDLMKQQQICFISQDIFTISREILILDDIVAIYRKTPKIDYLEIQDITYAQIMRQLFEVLWQQATLMNLGRGGAASVEK